MNISSYMAGIASRIVIAVTAFTVLMAISIVPAFSLEWLAHRLRGPVHIVANGEWLPISRGDIVHSGTIVRTGPSGTVEFHSGPNIVALSTDTQVKFIDWSDRGQTWVQQWFGEVEVDVEVRNVSHFAVQTPTMVAVVKGTRFTVRSSESESSVNVIRGAVAVEDTTRGHFVDLGAGQSATGSTETVMNVTGNGNLPTVVTAQGRPVLPPAAAEQAGQAPAPAARALAAPGNGGNTPAALVGTPGNSGNTPASLGGAPGNSGNTPVSSSGGAPGNSGNTPAASGGGQGNGNGNGNDGGGGLLGGLSGVVGGLLGGN